MKVSDDSDNILFCKWAFSDVLEGTALNFFLVASPLTPSLVSTISAMGLFLRILFDLLAKICLLQKFLTLNLISTLASPLKPVQLSAQACLVAVNVHNEC